MPQGKQIIQLCDLVAHKEQVFKIGKRERNHILDETDLIIRSDECANAIKECKPAKGYNSIITQIYTLEIVLNKGNKTAVASVLPISRMPFLRRSSYLSLDSLMK